ncbi:MAG TPA: SDR family NAD(P)-dependent oxidoreductase [Legionella sp.]|nr:SDR family NAD(P)-dependent oxidoreductase [Legionella sp.]
MRITSVELLPLKLKLYARLHPDKIALRFLKSDYLSYEEITYAELYNKSIHLAGVIQATQTDGPILLVLETGIDYMVAFFACIYAGRIAVTAYPPRKTRNLNRLTHIINNSEITLILSHSHVSVNNKLYQLPQNTVTLNIHEMNEQSINHILPDFKPDDIAYLQYTSGSTGSPKGVIITHQNIAANLILFQEIFGLEAMSLCVNWMPLYHDMGLVGCTLLPLYYGGTVVFMSPTTFLKNPLFWFESISKYKATYTMSPNFGYDLAVDAFLKKNGSEFDFSSIHYLINGAEPIKPSTLRKVSSALEPYGLRKGGMRPGYGMAETTLVISMQDKENESGIREVSADLLGKKLIGPATSSQDTAEVISCGIIPASYDIKIVDPVSKKILPDNHIGEIWLKGLSVSKGYYNNPEKTEEIFHAYTHEPHLGPYLRTGDLGALNVDKELIICGREKDLIIINGRNIYPQDVERATYESHNALVNGNAAAFFIIVNDIERLIIVAEAKKHLKSEQHQEIFKAVKSELFSELEVIPYDIVLIPPHLLCKTSSGKIQRSTCKELYLDNKLKVMASLRSSQPQADEIKPAFKTNNSDLVAWLTNWIATRQKINADSIHEHQAFTDFGLDSVAQIQLTHDLEELLNTPLDPWLLWQYPNISSLVNGLTHQQVYQEQHHSSYSPIAIIGMDCRFPGPDEKELNGLGSFWHALMGQEDSIRPIPKSRWNNDLYFSQNPYEKGKLYTNEGGFLNDIKQFDARFFNISPLEANLLDPQQRISLEVAWHALEDANIAPAQLRDTDTGIFLGISTHDYEALIQKNGNSDHLNTYQATGTSFATAAGRIAYFLGTQGPCMAIDTACSSSLVTVHQAVRSLQNEECSLAIAGGVNLILSPENNIIFCKSNMLSPDNRCYTFDEKADGYVRGEGCGMVVLKRLDKAISDGDKIYAVIKGSAVNQDGASNGLTAPSLIAQMKVMQAALKNANVDSALVSHIEAHGTGTSLGDPIEWEGIRQIYGQKRTSPLYITSLKTRLGHLEAASGIASLIKTALAIYYQTIPSHLNFKSYNPKITQQENIIVPLETIDFKKMDPMALQHAGVSSFGFSGTNAHIILSKSPVTQIKEPSPFKDFPGIWVISAKNKRTLEHYLNIYQSFGEKIGEDDFLTMCYQMLRHRSQFKHRAFIVANSRKEWLNALNNHEWQSGKSRDLQIGWLFSGQEILKPDFAKSIYLNNPKIAETIDKCCELTNSLLPYNLKTILLETPESIDLNDILHAHPALYVFEYALAQWWINLGIKPKILLGHSLGEYVAATIAGVISLEDALKLICVRSKLIAALPNNGDMLALSVDKTFQEKIKLHFSDLYMAIQNNENQLVYSGSQNQIIKLQNYCQKLNVDCQLLTTSYALHSPLMDSIIDEFHEEAEKITYSAPSIPLISSLTGTLVSKDEINADYWCKQLVHSVHFYQGLQEFVQHDVTCVQEIGPNATLVHLCTEFPFELCISSQINPSTSWNDLLKALGTLYINGASIQWDSLNNQVPSALLSLPKYPFNKKTFWFKSTDASVVSNVPRPEFYKLDWVALPDDTNTQVVDKKQSVLITLSNDPAVIKQLKQLTLISHIINQAPELHLLPDSAEYYIYYCDAQFDSIKTELMRFQILTQNLIKENNFKPLVIISKIDSPIGTTLLGGIKSLRIEYPHWPIHYIEGDIHQNPILWQHVLATLTKKELTLKIDKQLFKQQLVPCEQDVCPKLILAEQMAEKIYLITGGNGEVGQQLIKHLLQQGVKYIVAVGRKASPPLWNEAITEYLSINQCQIHYFSCDISKLTQVKKLFKKLNTLVPPITSVIHAAGIINDKLWGQTTQEDLEQVLAGKAYGALNLHLATQDAPIKDFIMISSLAGIIGNKGQVAYSLANAFLNALNDCRVNKGLPSMCFNLGPIKNTGLFKHDEARLTLEMEKLGVTPLAKESLRTLLEIETKSSHLVLSCLNIGKLGVNNPKLLSSPPENSPHDTLELIPENHSIEIQLLKIARNALHATNEELMAEDNWFKAGMDSLMASQLVFKINKIYPGVNINAADLFKHPSAIKLAQKIKNTSITSKKLTLPSSSSTRLSPLSMQQQEIWNYCKGSSPATYLIPIQLQISGDLNVDDFKISIVNTMNSHDIFRFQFTEIISQVNICIADSPQLDFTYVASLNEEVVDDFLNKEFHKNCSTLCRFLLYKEYETSHLLFIVIHHLIADGFTAMKFIEQIFKNYQKPVDVAPNKKYQDYIEWQRQNFLPLQQTQFLDFWKKRLYSIPVNVPDTKDTGLPLLGKNMQESIPIDSIKSIRDYLGENHLTLTNYCLTCLSEALLHAFNREQQGIVIFFSGREDGEFTKVFGDTTNDVIVTLTKRNATDPLSHIMNLQNQILDLVKQQHFRIQLLKEYNLLPEISYDFQNNSYHLHPNGSLAIQHTKYFHVQSRLWGTDPRLMSFKVLQTEHELIFSLKYRSDKIDEQTASDIFKQWTASITTQLDPLAFIEKEARISIQK